MKLPRRNFLHLAAGAAALPAISRVAWAQAYPSRPVRLIVGFPAGGLTDILARLLGPWLSERLGQQFIVEDQPGAGRFLLTGECEPLTAGRRVRIYASRGPYVCIYPEDTITPCKWTHEKVLSK
jgi:hypothetical protein